MVILTASIFFWSALRLPDEHGGVDYQLFLSEEPGKSPLVVGFGGSEGGMVYAGNGTQALRDSLNHFGYHFLVIGYFGTANSPEGLDRISLDAIYDTLMRVSDHSAIDQQRIIVLGGSRGAELGLNLASRYKDIAGVMALVPAHVSTCSSDGKTGGWTYEGDEVPYVPTTLKSIAHARKQEFLKMYEVMFEDEEVVNRASIEVEKINGPILFISASDDETWPSTLMSDKMMERLHENNFPFSAEHVIIEGGHAAPSKRSDLIYDFLEEHFPSNP